MFLCDYLRYYMLKLQLRLHVRFVFNFGVGKMFKLTKVKIFKISKTVITVTFYYTLK